MLRVWFRKASDLVNSTSVGPSIPSPKVSREVKGASDPICPGSAEPRRTSLTVLKNNTERLRGRRTQSTQRTPDQSDGDPTCQEQGGGNSRLMAIDTVAVGAGVGPRHHGTMALSPRV
jgi:hypothetical protein